MFLKKIGLTVLIYASYFVLSKLLSLEAGDMALILISCYAADMILDDKV